MVLGEERLSEKKDQRGQVLFELELEFNTHKNELKAAEKEYNKVLRELERVKEQTQ